MLIAIEGCLGVGKTTVARGLAKHRNASLLLEDFESNPFLRAFYKDPTGTALETEFAFLMLHFHQFKEATKLEKSLVADFHIAKDLLYADLNLTDQRVKRVFSDLYQLCIEILPRVDLVVFLSASTDLVVERIQQRNRDFEQAIDVNYYKTVNAAYEEFFARYPDKKLRVDMNVWDFVKSPSLFHELSKLVDATQIK